MLFSVRTSQLASKVDELLKRKALAKGKGGGMLTEGGNDDDEINWLLAKDQVLVCFLCVWASRSYVCKYQII